MSGNKTTTGLAAFQVNPTALNFGKVGVGKQATQTIAVANTGTMPVSITQATLSNPQFSLAGVTLPMAIGTGQSGNFTVGVTPLTAGTLTGTLTLMWGYQLGDDAMKQRIDGLKVVHQYDSSRKGTRVPKLRSEEE